jgi:hypothetical protein
MAGAALFEMDAVDADGDGNGDHLQPISSPDANQFDRKPEYARDGSAIVFFRSETDRGGGGGDLWKLVIQDGMIMETVVNLTRTAQLHEYGAAWKRGGVCSRKSDGESRLVGGR